MENEDNAKALEEMWRTFVGTAFSMPDIDALVVVATQEDGSFRQYMFGDFLKAFGAVTLLKDDLALHGLRNGRYRREVKDGESAKGSSDKED